MKTIFTRKEQNNLDEIRKELLAGRPVHVVNEYETFYGSDFDSWLRKGIADIKVEINVTSMNKWYGYPWSYDLTPIQ